MTKEKKTSALPRPFTSLKNLLLIVFDVQAPMDFFKINATLSKNFYEVILSVESYSGFRNLLNTTYPKTV